MKKSLTFLLFTICTLVSTNLFSQGLAVNTDASTADPSAMLDVKATDKGVLIPRLASTSAVTSPVTGLLVYQTGAPAGFYYYDGAAWLLLQNSSHAVTSADILDGTITDADINASAAIAYNKLSLTNSIKNSDIVANAITTSKVANGTVTTSKMADSAISSLKLLTYAVWPRHINVTGASAGQALIFDGSSVGWATPAGGSFPAITTDPSSLASITTSATYQTMKSITLPSTGRYLITAFVNITSHQADDEYHAKITQGGTILTGNSVYYAADDMMSLSTVVNITAGNLATPVLIECNNSGVSSGTAVGTYSVVKLSN